MLRRLLASWQRLRAFVARGESERELAAEIDSHLELHTDDNLRRGLTPAEARRQAVLALGGVEQTKERYRDRLGLPALDALIRDIGFGARMLRKHRAFAITSVFTLALGFGPPIAIFTLAHWMVLRPLPGVRDAGSVSLFRTGTPNNRGGLTTGRVSYVNLREIGPRLRTLTLAGTQVFAGATVSGGGRPAEQRSGAFVSGSYFDVLGVRMQTGRAINAADDEPSAPGMVAVISDGLWASAFDRQASAIGQAIDVNGHPVTVIGVVDAEFHGERRGLEATFWMPGVTEAMMRALDSRPSDRSTGGYYEFVARAAPGRTWPQVEAELASVSHWLLEQHPVDNAKFRSVRFHNQGLVGDFGQQPLVRLLGLMFVAAVLVLLVASANVASLLLMRGLGRREEFALRRALGASRWRVARQHATEVALLWAVGAAAGLLLVWVVLHSGVTDRVAEYGLPVTGMGLGWQVVTLAIGLALLVGVVFSFAPAWWAAHAEPVTAMRGTASTASKRLMAAPILTAAQLALCLALIVGALATGAAMRHLLSVDLGFDPSNVSVFLVAAAPGTSAAVGRQYLSEYADRISAHTHVETVAVAHGAPFLGADNFVTRVRGDRAGEFQEARMNRVMSPDYFAALGTPLVRGRTFTPDEILASPSVPRAVIVSRALALHLFDSIDVVGRTIEEPLADEPALRLIVGVAADVRVASLTGDPPLLFYRAGSEATRDLGGVMIVRTRPGATIEDHIRRVAISLGSAPPAGIYPLSAMVTRARGGLDALATLLIVLALTATALAAVGVYGVAAFAASSRRAEFGIRMALGATAAMVRRDVLGGVAIMTIAGLLIGLAGSFGLIQLIRSRLVGVDPFDPVLWIAASALLVALVAVASLVPARRAARANLADVLKAN